jgi:hypothetical protein
MNKFKVILLIVVIILVIIMIFMFDVISAFILQSEKIGINEIKLMVESKYDKNREVVEIDQNLKIPLPIGSIKFETEVYSYNNQYLVSNKNMKDFLNNKEGILDEYDLICEQSGSSILIKNKYDNTEYFNFVIHQYTSNFIRLLVNNR